MFRSSFFANIYHTHTAIKLVNDSITWSSRYPIRSARAHYNRSAFNTSLLFIRKLAALGTPRVLGVNMKVPAITFAASLFFLQIVLIILYATLVDYDLASSSQDIRGFYPGKFVSRFIIFLTVNIILCTSLSFFREFRS